MLGCSAKPRTAVVLYQRALFTALITTVAPRSDATALTALCLTRAMADDRENCPKRGYHTARRFVPGAAVLRALHASCSEDGLDLDNRVPNSLVIKIDGQLLTRGAKECERREEDCHATQREHGGGVRDSGAWQSGVPCA